MSFSIGDVVMLNSGSRLMTVSKTIGSGDDFVECCWFDDCYDLKREYFDGKCLKLHLEPVEPVEPNMDRF